jgi:hypothetical protein
VNKHYIFWPFKSGKYETMGGDIQGAGRTLRDFRRPPGDGTVQFIRYGSRKHLGALANCNAPNKSLYVTGHGTSGWQSIANTPNADDEVLHALVVVARLIEYGLRQTSECQLKLFSCYSGTDTAQGGFSFARAVHFFLRQLGYNRISVHGYQASISPYAGGDHTGFRGVNPLIGIDGVWTKASTVRVQIPG